MTASSDLGKIMEAFLVKASEEIENAKTMASEKKLTPAVLLLGISKGYSGAAVDIFAKIASEAMRSLNPALLTDVQELAEKLGDVLDQQKSIQEVITDPSRAGSWST